MMLKRSNHIPIRTTTDTAKSPTELTRTRRQNSASGAMQLQKYMSHSAHAYDFVTRQNSDERSKTSALSHAVNASQR